MNQHKPFVIGLVGGVAAGKSHVARALERLGAVTIDADQLGHQVLAKPAVVRQLVQLFGPTVVSESGTVDRPRLGALVFGDAEAAQTARLKLEALVHPLIHAAALEQLRGYQQLAEPPVLVVIDAPLLLEANWAPMCDAIFYVDSPVETRAQRARERGWTRAQFESREAAQLATEEKKRQATQIIAGDTEPEALERQLRRVLEPIFKRR